ncbi:NAD-dependent 5,10-methylenetetrahydrafolate dehydrogenase [Pichia californica]|uniref:NAD-dependent 5,10-methylenetetrahydrafolate dehydrogenase n=1 Tax=Pichia californica TaxID=460514 RepID=A0A9P6WI54_9ASCO|nr:NAD-dependent 5,10-methylenetetrahydrafolate dehydrogenase [[Candida] californica]KAG0687341.1 NAD-dependent 5,10-methylenetetrahydrafolate dehydrogenase [[Candida] californica]
MSIIQKACKVIPASKIAKSYINEITDTTSKLVKKPKLVGLLANDDPAALMYATWTGKTANNLGFQYELIQVSKDQLEEEIYKCNNNDEINGMIVYFPVFGNKQDQYLQQCVSIHKDVEGLNFKYISNMYHNIRYLDDNSKLMKSILPCTPLAIVKILEFIGAYNKVLDIGDRLYGKTITIVNRSEIVGRPLAALLANDGATVYSVDINDIQLYERGDGLRYKQHKVEDCNKSLEDCAKISDIIITGVPNKTYKFPTNYIKRGAIVINFSSEKNFNDEDVEKIASLYVPSIGKVTIAMLLRNLLRLMDNKKAANAKSIETPIQPTNQPQEI